MKYKIEDCSFKTGFGNEIVEKYKILKRKHFWNNWEYVKNFKGKVEEFTRLEIYEYLYTPEYWETEHPFIHHGTRTEDYEGWEEYYAKQKKMKGKGTTFSTGYISSLFEDNEKSIVGNSR